MMSRLLLHSLISLLVFSCSPQEDGPPISHPDRMTIWAEFMTQEQISDYMTFAGENKLNVNLAVIEGEHDRDYVKAVCKAAAKNDVALRFWPLLTHEKGYWPGQSNVEDFTVYVWMLRDWAADICPRLEGMVIDLEMPYDRSMEMQRLFTESESVADIATFLFDGIDDDAFENAKQRYAQLVLDLKAEGLHVSASTLGMIADDFQDGDETIAKMMWTPVEGIEWDCISFQVYRSFYDSLFAPSVSDPPEPFTSGLVTSYSRSIIEKFGDRGAVDLGTTGAVGIGIESGLASAAELQSDIAAALAEGILVGHVNIYSLEGLFEHSDPEAWVTVPSPQPAEIDSNTEEIRNIFILLDRLRTY